MLLHLGASLSLSHAPSYTLLPNAATLSSWASPNIITFHQQRRKRLTQTPFPNSPLCLHPIDSAPEGVPSNLFQFRPRKEQPQDGNSVVGGGGDDGGSGKSESGEDAITTAAVATVGVLEAGLVEYSDLGGVSALLVETSDLLPVGEEFSKADRDVVGKALELAKKYLFYAIKSRCGNRLVRGDFALSKETLVLAVKDTSVPSKNRFSGGEVVAVVELTLQEPNGKLPKSWRFLTPWAAGKPAKKCQPYMCNLVVAEGYRGEGYGKQLVRLCEHIAKDHWGYERMYLHVILDNPVATALHSKMGYENMEQYDTPFKRLFGMPTSTVRYQVKDLTAC